MNDLSCYCMVDIDGDHVQAKILHLRRGRYRIEEGTHLGRIIDASDVISRNIDRA